MATNDPDGLRRRLASRLTSRLISCGFTPDELDKELRWFQEELEQRLS